LKVRAVLVRLKAPLKRTQSRRFALAGPHRTARDYSPLFPANLPSESGPVALQLRFSGLNPNSEMETADGSGTGILPVVFRVVPKKASVWPKPQLDRQDACPTTVAKASFGFRA